MVSTLIPRISKKSAFHLIFFLIPFLTENQADKRILSPIAWLGQTQCNEMFVILSLVPFQILEIFGEKFLVIGIKMA